MVERLVGGVRVKGEREVRQGIEMSEWVAKCSWGCGFGECDESRG